ncbi:MAG: NAD(P)H-dependent oxidoreductase [Rhodobacteraceae bacterium]|nr:NAD(P)H-dependent oxidoreductase [Paracoccaceae bacterium]
MPSTLLHIDASARISGSTTRSLSAQIIDHLAPDQTIRRDLADPLAQITETWVNANFTPSDQRSPAQVQTLKQSTALVDEIQRADTIVIGLPIYNFAAPASFKLWIDLIARAGLTFHYTDTGPKGLLTGKRAIIAIASGGTTVGSDADFASGYVRHILGFIGITDVTFVVADAMMVDADSALTNAANTIKTLAA